MYFSFVSGNRLRGGAPHYLRGTGPDADGPARLALPGALYSADQPRSRTVAQRASPVLDRKWICGEYQFDMTAFYGRTQKDFKNKKQNPIKTSLNNKRRVEFKVE